MSLFEEAKKLQSTYEAQLQELIAQSKDTDEKIFICQWCHGISSFNYDDNNQQALISAVAAGEKPRFKFGLPEQKTSDGVIKTYGSYCKLGCVFACLANEQKTQRQQEQMSLFYQYKNLFTNEEIVPTLHPFCMQKFDGQLSHADYQKIKCANVIEVYQPSCSTINSKRSLVKIIRSQR